MKSLLFGFIILLVSLGLKAQLKCGSDEYKRAVVLKDPLLSDRISATEEQLQRSQTFSREIQGVIRIPVVVHILYHYPGQKLSDAQVNSQLAAMNRDFRRMADDTVNTPSYFKPLAADCEMEFYLATSDPLKRATTGIIRKYTPVLQWEMDDKVKFSSEMGDDAWDPRSYLNIWVCDLKGLAGYSSMLGGPENKDGIVIDFEAFGTLNAKAGYELGRTVIHETGHWLGLKHLWADPDQGSFGCGDDGIGDTPKQSFYTVGCPTGIRVTCNNGPYGNMYMNYMDFTEDKCMNLFTQGQKIRMRSLFSQEGPRNSLLYSKGLDQPLIFESELPEPDPTWLQPRLFPNPAIDELTIDLSYDSRWVGKMITIINLSGQRVATQIINNKIQKIGIKKLQAGIYFLEGVKEDGQRVREKFIKL